MKNCVIIKPKLDFPLQAMREYQKRAHAPPLWESRDVVVVSGSQDGLSKALEAIIGPGDPIIVQDPYYPGASVVVNEAFHVSLMSFNYYDVRKK